MLIGTVPEEKTARWADRSATTVCKDFPLPGFGPPISVTPPERATPPGKNAGYTSQDCGGGLDEREIGVHRSIEDHDCFCEAKQDSRRSLPG